MKVLVPVKRVIDYNVKVRVKADGSGSVVDLSRVTSFIDQGTGPFSSITRSNGGQILVDSLAEMATVNIVVNDGAVFSFPSLTTYSHGATWVSCQATLQAAGPGSVLDVHDLAAPDPRRGRVADAQDAQPIARQRLTDQGADLVRANIDADEHGQSPSCRNL